jgi:hypothetical protein
MTAARICQTERLRCAAGSPGRGRLVRRLSATMDGAGDCRGRGQPGESGWSTGRGCGNGAAIACGHGEHRTG